MDSFSSLSASPATRGTSGPTATREIAYNSQLSRKIHVIATEGDNLVVVLFADGHIAHLLHTSSTTIAGSHKHVLHLLALS